jgi:hypothetical protein
MSNAVWGDIERTLVQLSSLPHNAAALSKQGSTPEAAARKKLAEIKSGILGIPVTEEYVGPRLFLRVVGPTSRVYSGEWWFEGSLLDSLDTAYSRIYFATADRRMAIRDMLRELLAVSTEWNAMTEIWVLEVPPGERLLGYSGRGNRQLLFGGLPLTDKANRMLVGQAKQIFFPVKNPLWVSIHRHLAP